MDTKNAKIQRLAKVVGTHPSTIAKGFHPGRYVGVGKKTAKLCESAAKVSRLKWLYPEEFGDPFADIPDGSDFGL